MNTGMIPQTNRAMNAIINLREIADWELQDFETALSLAVHQLDLDGDVLAISGATRVLERAVQIARERAGRGTGTDAAPGVDKQEAGDA